jgi:hypothetical protein
MGLEYFDRAHSNIERSPGERQSMRRFRHQIGRGHKGDFMSDDDTSSCASSSSRVHYVSSSYHPPPHAGIASVKFIFLIFHARSFSFPACVCGRSESRLLMAIHEENPRARTVDKSVLRRVTFAPRIMLGA